MADHGARPRITRPGRSARAGKPPFAADWTAPPRALAAGSGRASARCTELQTLADAIRGRRSSGSTSGSRSSGGATTRARSPRGGGPSGRSPTRRRPSVPAICSIPTRRAACRSSSRRFTRRDDAGTARAVRGVRLQRERPADLGRAGVRGRGGARAARSGRAGRRRGRALRQGSAGGSLSAGSARSSAAFRMPRRFASTSALLSIWIGAFAQARRELRLAVAEDPKTPFGTEARTLLKRLENVRTR